MDIKEFINSSSNFEAIQKAQGFRSNVMDNEKGAFHFLPLEDADRSVSFTAMLFTSHNAQNDNTFLVTLTTPKQAKYREHAAAEFTETFDDDKSMASLVDPVLKIDDDILDAVAGVNSESFMFTAQAEGGSELRSYNTDGYVSLIEDVTASAQQPYAVIIACGAFENPQAKETSTVVVDSDFSLHEGLSLAGASKEFINEITQAGTPSVDGQSMSIAELQDLGVETTPAPQMSV